MFCVLSARTEYVSSEVDRVIITDVNLPLLEKVMSMDPDWKNIDSIMAKLNVPKPKEKPILDDGTITLEETNGPVLVSGKAWNEYWRLKGKTGPESGWDIPTSADIKKVVGFI